MKAVFHIAALAFGLSSIAMGCDNKEQERAQREVAEKADKAKQEVEHAASLQHAADEAAAKATKDRLYDRQTLQKDVDGVDRKLASLKERAAKVTGNTKKNSDAAVAEVEKRRATVQADLRKLETESGAAWDGLKTTADSDIASLKKSLDAFESAVTGK